MQPSSRDVSFDFAGRTVLVTGAASGIGEAVASAVAGRAKVEILGVREVPRSGKPAELMKAHGIDASAIVAAVKRILNGA